ncbi:MAG: hypothetical protein K1X56_00710 [Flavobacteriales bacterium]|nr:hypothetical protein [Flavobacteriales bacterium]
MYRFVPLIFVLAILSNSSIAGTFTSNGTGAWDQPGTWIFSGDANGIPDADDDVTILSGHVVTVGGGINGNCLTLTVNNGGNIAIGSAVLYIWGDYTNNGIESSSGAISFKNSGLISGTGTFGASVRYTIANTRTISAGTVITKNVTVRFLDNVVVTNNGSLTLTSTVNGNNVTFTNGATGSLTLKTTGFLNGAGNVFNASASGNTVTVQYNSSTLPAASSSTFHHLVINGTNITQPSSSVVNGNFTVNASRSFSMNGFDFSVGGNFANSGTFTVSTGNVTFNGTSAQNVTSSSAIAFNNVTFNNASGVNVNSGTYTISGVMTVSAGNVNTGSNLITLLSNAGSTARIAPVTGSISGSMTIQRFISARSAGYSDMSSPVVSSTFQDWDNELLLIYPYNPPGSYPSQWSYNEDVQFDYVPITSAATALTPGVGYEVYLDSDGGYTTFNATTLTTVGTPNTGAVNVTVTRVNDGWNLVGNPFASYVSINTLRSQNSGEIAATWGFYDETISDFSYTTGGEVAPHQGFWVESNLASTTLTFNETAKTTTTSSTFRNSEEVRLALKLESEGLTKFTSSTYFEFLGNTSTEYEQGTDVTFKKVPHQHAPALYSYSTDGKALRISKMPFELEKQIPLEYNVGIEGFYTLSINDMSIAQDLGYSCVVLEDKKTGSFHDLSSGAYRFNASQNEKSRFVLHLSNNNSACEKIQSSAVAALEGVNINRTSEGVFVEYNLDSDQSSVISVVNVLGQDIVNARSVSVSTGKIRIQLPADYSGIFIVNVQLGDKMISKKFFNL